MKHYQTPQALLDTLNVEDVITASLTDLGENGSSYEDHNSYENMFG